MALSTKALTTLTVVKDELDITDGSKDTRLERYIEAASQAIIDYCGRKFHYQVGIVEKVPGLGTERLMVSRAPVVTVTSITYDGQSVDSTSYESLGLDAEIGCIFRRYGWLNTANVQQNMTHLDEAPGTERKLYTVTYTGGYVTPQLKADNAGFPARDLPEDLEHACALTVVAMYRNRGKDEDIASESLGDASVVYRGRNTAIGQGLMGLIPDKAVPILNAYRRLGVTP